MTGRVFSHDLCDYTYGYCGQAEVKGRQTTRSTGGEVNDSRQPCPTHPDHWRYPDSKGGLRCSACDGAACCAPSDECNWQAGECHCGAFQESWECVRASCTLTDDQHAALFAAIAHAAVTEQQEAK